MRLKKLAVLIAAAGIPMPAFATNGMNMEGYGPVATGMGGASFAYDNGNAGMINNPATLGFMKSGEARLDVAIGGLHPSVTTNSQDSSADAFFMPAFGYVRKTGRLSYGVGMMAQGGMGTEYSNGNFWGTLAASGSFTAPGTSGYETTLPGSTATALASARAKENMSEVGVGRLIFPLAYEVNDRLTLAGSIDYVWAGMDIKWLVDGAHFVNMMPGQTQLFGRVAPGSLVTAFNAGVVGGAYDEVGYGYFDAANGNKFSQKATGDGYAGNLGFTYKASPKLTIGGVYHSKTKLSDMKTNSSEAKLVFGVNGLAAPPGGPGLGVSEVALTGQIIVKNFQWPETYGIGFSYQVSDAWQLAVDYKRINWGAVMKNFSMAFVADGNPMNGTFANTRMDMDFYQNWKDQNVLMLGAAYKYSEALTLRFGGNFANNPVPNSTVTPLFPAIVKNHITFGLGYQLSKQGSVDFSLTHAPKVTVTNNWSAAPSGNPTTPASSNQTISMSQTNWQLMYSHRF